MSASELVSGLFVKGFALDPKLTVSEWADANRVLDQVSSAEPGAWRTDRTPYLREVMDCLSPSSVYIQRVVAMFGAQLGKTEAGLNWIGYVMQYAPGPMLMVQPTDDVAKRYSKQRIAPLIRNSPAVQKLVRPARSRDSGNTLKDKEFPGGMLMMTGANSPVGLSSTPCRYVFGDELDRWPPDVGGEGDPVVLSTQRAANFKNRKLFFTSTPTIKGFSPIAKLYRESDQRHYLTPCPGCGEKQALEWAQVKWPQGCRDQAFYQCLYCATKIQEHQKGWMLKNGVWVTTAKGDGRTAGFFLNSLYSPWLTWAEVAIEHGQAGKDPVRLKAWTNTKMAQEWEDAAAGVDGEGLLERREEFGPLLPPDVALLTAGVDVQGDRLELEVVGWGRDEESWSVDYRILPGDPFDPEVWKDLDEYLSQSFPHGRLVSDMSIRAVCLDTGGHHTLKAYDFCRPRQGRRIWAIKGQGGMGVPIWPRRPSRSNKGKIPLFSVGVDGCKEAIYARLSKVTESGPGCMHFPKDRDAEYFRQLTAESLVTRYNKGRPVREWKKPDSARNEALDCRVYAMAALQGLISMGLRLNGEAERIQAAPLKIEASDSEKPLPAKTRARRRVIPSNWM